MVTDDQDRGVNLTLGESCQANFASVGLKPSGVVCKASLLDLIPSG